MPSDFDADYGYALGGAAAALAVNGVNGSMAVISSLAKDPKEWGVVGLPLTAILTDLGGDTLPDGRPRPRICPHRVDLSGPVFKRWKALRADAAIQELYENPGPIQFAGNTKASVPNTLELNSGG